MHRRDLLTALASTALAAAQTSTAGRMARKGRVKQTCFKRSLGAAGGGPPMSPDDMFRPAAHLGAVGFDFLPADQWPPLKNTG